VIARACVAAALLLLALPGVSMAKTKTVDMGVPPASATKFQRLGVDVNDFFPHTVIINVGDRVRFRPVGFHTVDLPPTGGAPLPLISPTGDKVQGVNDEAGGPFWFNGEDILGFTRALGPPGNFGKNLAYNGRKRRLSGVPLGERLRPMTVRFTRAGSFTYFCNVHPGMKGVVKARARGRAVPSRRADRRTVANQVRRSLRRARRLADARPPAGVVNVGVAGQTGEELFAFVPNEVTISAGQSLRFRMSPGSYDAHTATTGPGNPVEEPNSYLGELAATFEGAVFDPRATYQSEPPPTQATLTPLLHGNGFWSSGFMDRAPGTPPPSSNSVRFGTPGTYTFYCLIHPFMRGTVNVQ
jgi:plastocyanin